MCKLWVVLIAVVLAGCLKDVNTEEFIQNDGNSQADPSGADPAGNADDNSGNDNTGSGNGNNRNNGNGNGNNGNGNGNGVGQGSASFSLSWTAPTQNTDGSALTDLAGYRVYFGLNSGRYTEAIRIDTVGITRYVVDNVPLDTYFVVMTAVTAKGLESDYTNEVAVMSN